VNDSEYGARGRALDAQLLELERRAGVSDAAKGLRDAAPDRDGVRAAAEAAEGGLSDSQHSPLSDTEQRRDLRSLYFSVPQAGIRKALIAKHREVELFERTRDRVRVDDARRHLEAIRRRPAEGWWIASIVGAALVIIGYWLFSLAGAIAGGVAALFVGNGIEQAARRRYEHALAFAAEDLSLAEAALSSSESLRDLFSERESETGLEDRPLEARRGLSASAI
jgi:hypothetical protein